MRDTTSVRFSNTFCTSCTLSLSLSLFLPSERAFRFSLKIWKTEDEKYGAEEIRTERNHDANFEGWSFGLHFGRSVRRSTLSIEQANAYSVCEAFRESEISIFDRYRALYWNSLQRSVRFIPETTFMRACLTGGEKSRREAKDTDSRNLLSTTRRNDARSASQNKSRARRVSRSSATQSRHRVAYSYIIRCNTITYLTRYARINTCLEWHSCIDRTRKCLSRDGKQCGNQSLSLLRVKR